MTGPVAVHHTVSGPPDAPTVVLSNSLGATWAMWDAVLPALEERFQVVRHDTRGHGGSPAPAGPYTIDELTDDLLALLDTLGVARAHLVGLSLGGMRSLRLAARLPDRVDRLVVLCSTARFPSAEPWRARAAAVRADGCAAVARGVVERWFTPAGAAARPDLLRDAERMMAAQPDQGYAACCDAIADLDLRGDLPRVAAPTLAVAGAEDLATPPEHLAAIADGVPDGTLAVVSGAAHLAPWERPDPVASLILDHLTGVDRAEREVSRR